MLCSAPSISVSFHFSNPAMLQSLSAPSVCYGVNGRIGRKEKGGEAGGEAGGTAKAQTDFAEKTKQRDTCHVYLKVSKIQWHNGGPPIQTNAAQQQGDGEGDLDGRGREDTVFLRHNNRRLTNSNNNKNGASVRTRINT